LRRAAAKLREHAQAATPGPWHIGRAVDPMEPCNVHTFPGGRGVADEMDWLDAEYIALIHPPVALALADLIEEGLSYAAMSKPARYPIYVKAVAAARAILREPEESS
jgi:hypothetical protein